MVHTKLSIRACETFIHFNTKLQGKSHVKPKLSHKNCILLTIVPRTCLCLSNFETT